MITLENFRECLLILGKDEIRKCMDDYSKEYLLMSVEFSNACVWVTIESHDYNEGIEEEAESNGQLFCDKDTFEQLLKQENLLSFLN
jgi:hypothetical protein